MNNNEFLVRMPPYSQLSSRLKAIVDNSDNWLRTKIFPLDHNNVRVRVLREFTMYNNNESWMQIESLDRSIRCNVPASWLISPLPHCRKCGKVMQLMS